MTKASLMLSQPKACISLHFQPRDCCQDRFKAYKVNFYEFGSLTKTFPITTTQSYYSLFYGGSQACMTNVRLGARFTPDTGRLLLLSMLWKGGAGCPLP